MSNANGQGGSTHLGDASSRKSALRLVMRERRRGFDGAAGAALCAHLLECGLLRAGAVVAGFWPMVDEIDIRPALHLLIRRGTAVALPTTPPRGQPLGFCRWRPGDDLRPGRFGTLEPVGEPIRPDILLVPLLAWDRAGFRLGYGGGYYDRTLAALPAATAIGCGWAAQEVDSVPVEPHDRPLHAIATEAGVFSVE